MTAAIRQYAAASGAGCRGMAPGLLGAAVVGMAALLARRHRLRLPELDMSDAGRHPSVDVVVPARNEGEAIRRCVQALRASTAEVHVTVVDDASTDQTSSEAAQAQARVIHSDGPPPGWLGKPHACHLGALEGRAEWLAFVDADVTVAPNTISALVRHCEVRRADAASALLRQRCSGTADGLLVPFAFWQYMVGLPGASGRVVRGRARAILNGQCIVVRRDAYRACGGHAHPSVRHSIIEDSALARRLAECGRVPVLLRATNAGEVRMYDGLGAVRAGFGKNIGPFLAADPARGVVVALAGVAMSSTGMLAAAALKHPSPGAWAGAGAAYGAGVAALVGAYRTAGRPAAWALLHPLTATVMQMIALESIGRALLRRPPRWRGRALT